MNYYGASFTIVLYNILLRWVYTRIIKHIGYTSYSIQNTGIVLSIFMAFFCNYGLMYLVAPSTKSIAENIDSSGTVDKSDFKGIYPDPFNAYWFTDIGAMVALSMILEAIWPLLEYGVMFLIRWVRLGID